MFSKIARASKRTKFTMVGFVLLFAGVGGYFIYQSLAFTSAGYFRVHSYEKYVTGNTTALRTIGEVGFHITSSDPANYPCNTGVGDLWTSGTTTNGYSGPIWCGTFLSSTTGKQYTIDNINKPGYVSLGNATVTIIAGVTSDNPLTTNVFIAKRGQAFIGSNYGANSVTVPYGGDVTVDWNTSDSYGCTLQGAGGGASIATSGSIHTGPVKAVMAYYLLCSDATGSGTVKSGTLTLTPTLAPVTPSGCAKGTLYNRCPAPKVSWKCSGTTVIGTATYTNGGTTQHLDIDKDNNWANGGWYKNASGGGPTSLSGFTAWGSTTGSFTLAQKTTYQLRMAYFYAAGNAWMHTGNATLNTGKCAVVPKPKPKTPTVVKSSGTNTRIIVRSAPIQATNGDTTRPTAPGNLQANQLGTDEIDLSWDASTDSSGIAAYIIERSEDGKNWTTLDDTVTDTTYADLTASYGTKYTYRVSAKDNSGNFSDYALVDITTTEFTANAYADQDNTITSDDGVVTVDIPQGALSEDASCSIVDSDKSLPNGTKAIAGPYELVCKIADGSTVDKFNSEVTVTINLPSDLNKKASAFYIYNGDKWQDSKLKYSSQSPNFTYASDQISPFSIVSASSKSSMLLTILIVLLVVGIFAGVLYIFIAYVRSN